MPSCLRDRRICCVLLNACDLVSADFRMGWSWQKNEIRHTVVVLEDANFVPFNSLQDGCVCVSAVTAMHHVDMWSQTIQFSTDDFVVSYKKWAFAGSASVLWRLGHCLVHGVQRGSKSCYQFKALCVEPWLASWRWYIAALAFEDKFMYKWFSFIANRFLFNTIDVSGNQLSVVNLICILLFLFTFLPILFPKSRWNISFLMS